MNQSLTKRFTSVERLHVQLPFDIIAATNRASERYIAKLERAKAEYVQAIRDINAGIPPADEPVTAAAVEPAPQTQLAI